MQKILVKIICYSLGIFLITACISKKEIAFAYIVPAGDMNGSVRLDLQNPKNLNDLRIGDEILLAINNISNYEIDFPPDYGVLILNFDEVMGDWNIIPNETVYSNEINELSFMPIDEKGVAFSELPRIENNDQPVDIRVVVMGKTTDNTIPASKEVGAFIDLTLQP
ncbi:MAG: hypothetical protein A2136_06555 [Chloroflexi bacterium RBG_16_54_11]|nr:MAG: hypothetical protein A2136_06555 [Chloroflexi bacterium RBG_16_54_11]